MNTITSGAVRTDTSSRPQPVPFLDLVAQQAEVDAEV